MTVCKLQRCTWELYLLCWQTLHASTPFAPHSWAAWLSAIHIWHVAAVPRAERLGHTLVNWLLPQSVHCHLTLIFLLWFPSPLCLLLFSVSSFSPLSSPTAVSRPSLGGQLQLPYSSLSLLTKSIHPSATSLQHEYATSVALLRYVAQHFCYIEMAIRITLQKLPSTHCINTAAMCRHITVMHISDDVTMATSCTSYRSYSHIATI